MNEYRRYLANLMFENQIYKLNGQGFEDFFVSIMTKAVPSFKPVKANGKYGDGKNDGFDINTGTYYQVYGPEDISNSKTVTDSLNKIEEDFCGLFKIWDNACKVKKFFFVVNDKFKGIPYRLRLKVCEMNKNNDVEINLFDAEDLKRVFNRLDDSDMMDIIGFIPDGTGCELVDYNSLSKVINYLLSIETSIVHDEKLVVPDFSDKIQFNRLNSHIASILREKSYQEGALNDYFNNYPGTKEILQKKFSGLYLESCEKIPKDETNFNDKRFLYIVEHSIPEKNNGVTSCVYALMSYYFSTCDIFEEPKY